MDPTETGSHPRDCVMTGRVCVCVFTISSSSRRAQMALSLLDTNSSRYWYLSFFRARHSLALCRLRSSLAFRSILAGLRPRFPGFFTFPATIWRQRHSSTHQHEGDHRSDGTDTDLRSVLCRYALTGWCDSRTAAVTRSKKNKQTSKKKVPVKKTKPRQ